MKGFLLLLLICCNTLAQTIDQKQTSINGYTAFSTNAIIGQTFTAGTSGPLAQITLALGSSSGTPYTATLNLHPTDASGIPILATILATATVSVNSPIPPIVRLTDKYFVFDSPYTITKDTKYAFSLTAPVGVNAVCNEYTREGGYYAGTEFKKEPNQDIMLHPIFDLYFITYLFAPLPVDFVSFTARSANSQALLEWQTSLERNSSHFQIQRSIDAQNFETIGRVAAQGNTDNIQEYRFIDSEIRSGLWYYRLREVDLDGSFSYSQIVAVRIGTESFETLTVSPNPSAGPLMLEYKNGLKSVEIYSVDGVLIKQQDFAQAVDRWNWTPTGQAAGMYIIQVTTQDGKRNKLRWIKQ